MNLRKRRITPMLSTRGNKGASKTDKEQSIGSHHTTEREEFVRFIIP
jgi:hypothetical protein